MLSIKAIIIVIGALAVGGGVYVVATNNKTETSLAPQVSEEKSEVVDTEVSADAEVSKKTATKAAPTPTPSVTTQVKAKAAVTAPTPAPVPTPTTVSGTASAASTIKMGYVLGAPKPGFHSPNVTMRVGDQISWMDNIDPAGSLWVESTSGQSFSSGALGFGQWYTVTLTTSGVIQYRNRLHPEHTGTITVQAAGTVVPGKSLEELQAEYDRMMQEVYQ